MFPFDDVIMPWNFSIIFQCIVELLSKVIALDVRNEFQVLVDYIKDSLNRVLALKQTNLIKKIHRLSYISGSLQFFFVERLY